MSERERWTIYVCPFCRWLTRRGEVCVHWAREDHEAAGAGVSEPLVVVPLSRAEKAEEERDRLALLLGEAEARVKCLEEELSELRGKQ